MEWRFLHSVESVVDAKKWLRKFSDDGENAKMQWKRGPGGETGKRLFFHCSAHVDCGARLRVSVSGGVEGSSVRGIAQCQDAVAAEGKR